ncbi:hypothetical protein CRE_21982 [Caenorhabditis remanei]|uniref:Sdz-33 F-box domain-containing protein n=1 Tax=Caenorhabditis remanei TaxID=31234 RepID=E3N3F0_CAERE|nr:hypothetical protein CRE_21982 [Caenorhabditis remanei]
MYSQKVRVVLDILYQEIRVYHENNKDAFKIFNYPDSEKILNSNIQQFSITCCTTFTIALNGSRDNNWMFNQISDKFGLVKDLEIISRANSNVRPIFASWPQNVDIPNSAWFTLEYLFACTCTTIKLDKSHLGNKDLNDILKNWKAGGFPSLERLKVYSHNIKNNGTTILGMNLMELNGMIIQTNDESKNATINTGFRYGCIEMCVTPFD